MQSAIEKNIFYSMESKVSMQHEWTAPLTGHVQANSLAIFLKHWNALQSVK